MNEKKLTPIERMAALLAEMTERAVEAERQRDAAKEDAANWYKLFCERDRKLSEAQAALDAQIKENTDLLNEISTYIEKMQNGDGENV